MDIPKVHKMLARYPDGRLVSLWVEESNRLVQQRNGGELTYEEGKITYALKGSQGIYTIGTLAEGKGQIPNGEGKKKQGATLVIHEAIPLGDEMPSNLLAYQDAGRYPAILLGKEVWREPAPEPIEEWVDVTGECRAKFLMAATSNMGGYYFQVHHEDACIDFGLGEPAVDGDYRVEVATTNHFAGMHTFKILHRVVK